MGNDHDHGARRPRPIEPDGTTPARLGRARDGTWPRDGRLHGDERRAFAAGVRARDGGIRRMRWVSNWTAAALVAGTGVGVVVLASQSSAGNLAPGVTGSAGVAGTQVTSGTPVTSGPHVTGSVVTSGGSGATVTTTTRVVNGRVVITHVRHPVAYHDS